MDFALTLSTDKAFAKVSSASSENCMYMEHTPWYKANLCCILFLQGH